MNVYQTSRLKSSASRPFSFSSLLLRDSRSLSLERLVYNRKCLGGIFFSWLELAEKTDYWFDIIFGREAKLRVGQSGDHAAWISHLAQFPLSSNILLVLLISNQYSNFMVFLRFQGKMVLCLGILLGSINTHPFQHFIIH